MNFLAHSLLSGDSESILLGNFIGDFVKGRDYQYYDPGIRKGILLHREIDSFSDQHYIFRQSKSVLSTRYRHYSGVVVDLFYDHFLARDFDHFSKVTLSLFAQEVYQTIGDHLEILPNRVSQMLPYMIRGNWLLSYADVSGIHRALSGLASRTKYQSNMEKASEDLHLHYAKFDNDFNAFFPQLVAHVQEWLSRHQ